MQQDELNSRFGTEFQMLREFNEEIAKVLNGEDSEADNLDFEEKLEILSFYSFGSRREES